MEVGRPKEEIVKRLSIDRAPEKGRMDERSRGEGCRIAGMRI